MLLAGLRQRHGFAVAENGVARQWRQFLSHEPLPGRVGSQFYGVMCGSDSSGFEYMAGVEVASFGELTAEMGRLKIPAQRYAVFSVAEDSTVGSMWQKILEWLASSAYASAHRPDFELYPIAPGSVSGGVEVWVGVVERHAHGEHGV